MPLELLFKIGFDANSMLHLIHGADFTVLYIEMGVIWLSVESFIELSINDSLLHIFQNADMQCSGCGKNIECHPYFACFEAGPDLERPNVRSLVHSFHVV